MKYLYSLEEKICCNIYISSRLVETKKFLNFGLKLFIIIYDKKVWYLNYVNKKKQPNEISVQRNKWSFMNINSTILKLTLTNKMLKFNYNNCISFHLILLMSSLLRYYYFISEIKKSKKKKIQYFRLLPKILIQHLWCCF